MDIKGDDVQGKIDYVGGMQGDEPKAPYVVVVEAKRHWPDDAHVQLLAEMYAVMMQNDKTGSLYGALTNESDWQFYKLDPDLKWHQSHQYARGKETLEILGILAAMFGGVESQ